MTATTKPVGALFAIDTARRDLQIAAEYKGMESANESALALITVRAAIAELIAADVEYDEAREEYMAVSEADVPGHLVACNRYILAKRNRAQKLAATQGENGGKDE